VRWVRLFYMLLIPLTIGGMLVHNALDFASKLVRPTHETRSREELPRMNLPFRIAHALAGLSFVTLAWTGFALKYPAAWWAAPILRWESAFAFRGLVHRAAAVVMIGALVFHAVHLVLRPRDRAMLRQVFINLFSNAVKYTRGRDPAKIQIGTMVCGKGDLLFYIRDNGVGFDMQHADKLFGAFQRLHSAGEFSGTGVGLATVQRIIHRHGGRIWAQSAVNEGATFHFTLS
jgi:hypothetical protein